MTMRLHPRTPIVAEATREIMAEFSKTAAKYDLSYGETCGILAEMLATEAKYMVRAERHPGNSDKKGDEA